MKYQLSLRREAVNDMGDAEAYYMEEEPGTERRFRDEVAMTLRRIQEKPRQFPYSEKRPYRQATLSIFPHCIYFLVQKEKIVIIAVHDARRDPARWHSRIKP